MRKQTFNHGLTLLLGFFPKLPRKSFEMVPFHLLGNHQVQSSSLLSLALLSSPYKICTIHHDLHHMCNPSHSNTICYIRLGSCLSRRVYEPTPRLPQPNHYDHTVQKWYSRGFFNACSKKGETEAQSSLGLLSLQLPICKEDFIMICLCALSTLVFIAYKKEFKWQVLSLVILKRA